MMRLFLLALLGLAVWQASIHYRDLLHREQQHEVVFENRSQVAITRLRVTIGDRTMVREEIAPGASATFRFGAGQAGTFKLVWQRADRTIETEWRGGQVTPAAQRHFLTLDDKEHVTHEVRDLPPAGAKSE